MKGGQHGPIVWTVGSGCYIAGNRRNVAVITDVSRNDTLADYKLKLSEILSAPMRRRGNMELESKDLVKAVIKNVDLQVKEFLN